MVTFDVKYQEEELNIQLFHYDLKAHLIGQANVKFSHFTSHKFNQWVSIDFEIKQKAKLRISGEWFITK
jgi:hypothetical protein